MVEKIFGISVGVEYEELDTEAFLENLLQYGVFGREAEVMYNGVARSKSVWPPPAYVESHFGTVLTLRRILSTDKKGENWVICKKNVAFYKNTLYNKMCIIIQKIIMGEYKEEFLCT